MWSFVSPVPLYWRRRGFLLRMEKGECEGCGFSFVPYRSICPRCGSAKVKARKLPRRGRVVSFTLVENPPRGFEYYTPYILAVVELEDGTRVFGQVSDAENLKIGDEVEATLRIVRVFGESGQIFYGFKFVPLSSPHDPVERVPPGTGNYQDKKGES